MLESLFVKPKTRERARRSWLKEALDGFLAKLAAGMYPRSTLQTYAFRLLRFGEFVADQGIREVNQLPRWVEPFLAQLGQPKPRASAWRSAVARFICHLAEDGVISLPSQPGTPVRPFADLVEGYARFLLERRGLSDESLRYTRRICAALMAFLGEQGVSTPDAIGPEDILRFLTTRGPRYCRSTLKLICTVLRGYLAYLHRSGVLPVNLSSVVVAPRVYRQEQCPRFLTRPEVERVLAVIDRRTPTGRRDYALVLLLSTYGLRGIEVIRLRLDDIDWRAPTIHVRGRKAGNSSTYPLAAAVGQAIVSYLEEGRPQSSHRQLFLSTLAPYPPLARSAALTAVVRKHLAAAGVQVPRPGTHTFRYSCAQRLFESGASLKTIGDYLGHCHPDSTLGYTKMAIDQLREVALGDGEDLL